MDIDKPSNEVSRPQLYTGITGIEVIDITEQLNFNMGNAVKHILESDKGKSFESDIKKAIWYLNRELKRRGYAH